MQEQQRLRVEEDAVDVLVSAGWLFTGGGHLEGT